MTGARCRLSAEPGSVAVARAAVRGYLQAEGVADPEPAVLLVSELVANAVMHPSAPQPIEVMLDIDRGYLHIEVHDSDPRPPVARPHAPEDECGRGLVIVDRVAEEWGWDRVDDMGKRVWCNVRAAAPGHGARRSR